jgi:hypothetical protein
LIRLFHHPDEVEEKDSWWGLAAGGRSPADMPSRAPFLSFFFQSDPGLVVGAWNFLFEK